jgi:hypothetical protein
MKLEQLFAFAKKHARREFADYGDVTAFRADYRNMTQHRKACEKLAWRFREREIVGVFNRLTVTETKIEYTTGQYMPTEIWWAVLNAMQTILRNDELNQ